MVKKSADQPKKTPKSTGPDVKKEITKKNTPFPIIGLGASAGGLKALKAFFSVVPEKNGMAYIVVVHMTPDHPSLLPDLLQKTTPLSVATAIDGQAIEPNHIYIIPPDRDLTVFKGRIQLIEMLKKSVPHPIDGMLRSLAQDRGRHAAAIILSGTGTDGTLGIKEIKANDGLILVQKEDSAEYDGMPRSAIGTGLADMVLLPQEMPEKLFQYFTHPKMAPDWKPVTDREDRKDWLNKIFAILRTQVGHDFSVYKVNTILRRIHRRMILNQIDSHDKYVRFMREHPAETDSLFREFLIGVTNFFRDAKSFEVLKSDILPDLLKPLKDNDNFRVWIPGCSTGEEVYSLAIILREYLDKNPRRLSLQLFGTDIDKIAIDKAREGLYPNSITADVSEERLNRFFTKEGNYYRIRKEIRDCVVFSEQDVIKDPPFSKLNMLCCRNLLIYLDAAVQTKLFPLFHYTLKSGGILMLGSSETIGRFTGLFQVLDKKWKIYRRKDSGDGLRQSIDFPSGMSASEHIPRAIEVPPVESYSDIARITRQVILDQFAPTALLIDNSGNILHIQGRTGNYLEALSGPPTQNILNLAREGLRIELASALRAARREDKRVTRKNIQFRVNSDIQTVTLHIVPQQSPKELSGQFLVVFEDVKNKPSKAAKSDEQTDDMPELSKRAELERELQITRESYQITVEELESSNEELKSTNEELQSSNEELQSTNEELESSKEELQSLNEELQTVNAELQSKLDELSASQDDMRNLLNSTEVATIFVDGQLRIRRYTAAATDIVNLIPTDVGRPLQHVVTNLSYSGMIDDLNTVLKKLSSSEHEVQTASGAWYKMRIMPYRTMDNRIDGGVLTFSSITAQKEAQNLIKKTSRKFEQAWEFIRAIFDLNPDPIVVLDNQGKVTLTNKVFTDFFKQPETKLEGHDFPASELGLPEHIGLSSKLKDALDKGENFVTETFVIKASGSRKKYKIQGRIIKRDEDYPYRIYLHFISVL